MFSIGALGSEVHLSAEQTLIITVLVAAARALAARLFRKEKRSVPPSSKLEISVMQDVRFERNWPHTCMLLQ